MGNFCNTLLIKAEFCTSFEHWCVFHCFSTYIFMLSKVILQLWNYNGPTVFPNVSICVSLKLRISVDGWQHNSKSYTLWVFFRPAFYFCPSCALISDPFHSYFFCFLSWCSTFSLLIFLLLISSSLFYFSIEVPKWGFGQCGVECLWLWLVQQRHAGDSDWSTS